MKNRIYWLIPIVTLSIPASLWAIDIKESDVLLEIQAVSPRMIQADASGFWDRRSSGLPVVGIGENCYLNGRMPEAADIPEAIEWSFTQKPAGSQSNFRYTDKRITAFSPDKEGWYEVQLSLTMPNAASAIRKKTRVLAAVYTGVGGLNDTAPAFPECALCHDSVNEEWKETRHAQVLARHLNGERSDQYDDRCFECHTVGFDNAMASSNNGFHEAIQNSGVDLQTLTDRINDAYRRNRDRDPKNDAAYYDSLSPAIRAKANVQCENCHGPGSQHFGNPAQIGKSWDARVCAQCHDSQGFDGYPYPYDSSRHKELPAIFAQFPSLLESACAKCHSAEGFVRLAINQDTLSKPEKTDPHAVSCVACHDPHDRTLPNQLRWVNDVVMENGVLFPNAGNGSICVICHQSRVPNKLETFIYNDTAGPHYGPQADVLLGKSAWTFGAELKQATSVHLVVTRDACVTCHMARIPANGWNEENGILVGGHSFKISNDLDTADTRDDLSNYRNACLPCHLTMTSVDRVMKSGQDYDGNGKVEGIQTEVRGLLGRIAERLRERYPDIRVGADLELIVPPRLFGEFTFSEKAVVYNYRLMVRDGSYGIHNGRFTIEILQRTYAALTLRSFKLDYPNAALIEDSTIPEWSMYK